MKRRKAEPRMAEMEIDRDQERDHHGGDLAPRIDAPPVPAQQEDEAGAGPDLQQDLECLHRISEPKRDEAGKEHKGNGDAAADIHIMLLWCVWPHEAAVDRRPHRTRPNSDAWW